MFGLVGGVACQKYNVPSWRGCGITYGSFLATLALIVLGLVLWDTSSSGDAVLEFAITLVLYGGVLGAPGLGLSYLLTRYLTSVISGPRTRS